MPKQKWVTTLGGLLVAQLVLLGVVSLGSASGSAFRQPTEGPLLSFDAAAVDEVRIEGADEGEVLLRKEDGVWRLPDHYDFPANGPGVEDLLGRLGSLQKGWPVATTDSAAERFRVSADAFERRVTLVAGGETEGQLLIGTSPGFRKIHAREATSSDVHAVEFAAYEASANADDWIDEAALALDPEGLSRVQLGELELIREGDDWVLSGLEAGEQTDVSEARALVRRLAELRIDSVVGTEDQEAFGLDEPDLAFELEPAEGEPLRYAFAQIPEDADADAEDAESEENARPYVLKVSSRPHYFLVAATSVDAIAEFDRDALTEEADEEEATEAGTETEAAEEEAEAGQAEADADAAPPAPAEAPQGESDASSESRPD